MYSFFNFAPPKKKKKIPKSSLKFKMAKSALETYGHDLVDKAENQKLDPVFGRHQEIRRLLTIICRKTKSNPMLIGEPGVGKTAVVEGLAQKIASGNVPSKLSGARIVSWTWEP